MRKLFLILVAALFFSSSSLRAQTRIEDVQGTYPNSANGTVALTLGTATITGEGIFVRTCVVNGFGSPAVTDNLSQVYTQLFTASVTAASNNFTCAIYYVQNSSSGVTSVTCKQSASSGHGYCDMTHYTGMATSSISDGFQTFNAGSTTPWSSTALATANANDVLLGMELSSFASGATCTPAVSGSWTLDGSRFSGSTFDGGNGNAAIVGRQIVSSTGSYQFTGTDGNALCTGKSAIAAFKGASSSVLAGWKSPTAGPSWAIALIPMIFNMPVIRYISLLFHWLSTSLFYGLAMAAMFSVLAANWSSTKYLCGRMADFVKQKSLKIVSKFRRQKLDEETQKSIFDPVFEKKMDEILNERMVNEQISEKKRRLYVLK